MSRTAVVLVVMALGVAPWGCSSGGEKAADAGAPLSAINDQAAHSDTRIKAIERMNEAVAKGEIDPKLARESLKRVAWLRGNYWKIRQAAIEELLADEAQLADTRNMLRLMLPTETQNEITAYICKRAGDGKWTELATAIVRRWSRPDARIPDASRPERAALAAIFPDRPVDDTVFEVFVTDTDGGKPLEERARMDAWGLLRRIDPGSQRTTALLTGVPSTTDPLVASLQRAARDLRCVPATGEELAWLKRLGGSGNETEWSRSASAVAKLNAEQTVGFKLRHLAAVRWAEVNHQAWLSMSRAQLFEETQASLNGRKKHWRAGDGTSGRGGESLHRWGDDLVWGDLLLVLIGAEMTKDATVAAKVFEECDLDIKDTSTEYGGVISGSESVGGGELFTVKFFPPRATERFGDKQFIPSSDMLAAGDTAVFSYHLHVNSWNNADYAGPSSGDIDSARELGRACMVFTAIDENTLNVDYYQAGGATIDLGDIRRPAK